ncbi:MAG: zf-HC2 domain-containing protein [Acidobacteriota bacterium]
MEVNFDKQIDTILQDLAKGNTFAESPPVSHLDADELSAFAENVLPPKARLRAMEHLADCTNCRKTLTTFFSITNETQSETLHEEAKTIATIPTIPWYRQLFAFPTLSYAMGAMALLLVGMVGYLVLQNSQDTANSVAKNEPVAEKVKGPSGASSEGDSPASEVYSANAANTSVASNTTATSANTASVATNTVPSNSSVAVSNTTTEPAKPLATATPSALGGGVPTSTDSDVTVADKSAERERDLKASKEDIVLSKGGESKKPATEVTSGRAVNEKQIDDSVVAEQRAETQVQNRSQNNVMTPDGGTTRSAPMSPPASKKVARREDEAGKDEANKPVPTKNVAGKTFSNANGTWTDSAYKGGSTTNVRRGTDEYKKLDSGLRSTADYLGGTVVIVWKGKNYKIQ